MKEGRKLDYPEQTPQGELQKMLQSRRIQTITEARTRTLALLAGWESRRVDRYATRRTVGLEVTVQVDWSHTNTKNQRLSSCQTSLFPFFFCQSSVCLVVCLFVCVDVGEHYVKTGQPSSPVLGRPAGEHRHSGRPYTARSVTDTLVHQWPC